MKLRITTRQSGVVTIVQIDGELRDRGVAELEKVCGSIQGPLCLDLANLQSIGEDGIRTIHALEGRGVAVAGESPYVRKLLQRIDRQ
jgi:anti-anti-sigma regulatory factor